MPVRTLCALALAYLGYASAMHATTHAAMTLGQTRVIVSDTDRRVMVPVTNADRVPVLLQAWIDEAGEADRPPESSNIPFVLDPPVMKLDPGQARAIQVVLTQVPTHLPKDRESLYWFNVLEVPALPADETGQDSRLDVSILSRLKLFYRPADVARVRYRVNQKSPVPALRFSLQGQALVIDNPAPIHQTLASLSINNTDVGSVMLAPFATIRVAAPPALPDPVRLTFATIDDDGNLDEHETILAAP